MRTPQQPVTQVESFFIRRLGLGHEVELRNIHAGWANPITGAAADTEAHPQIFRWIPGAADPLRSGPRHFRAGESPRGPGHRAVFRTDTALNTLIALVRCRYSLPRHDIKFRTAL